MDPSFWHQRWQENNIGFHKSEANPTLVKYFGELALTKGSRVFVPLCGKTLDIPWLLSEGYRVAGSELVEIAVEQLFDQLDIQPEISRIGEVNLYHAEDIDIFVGNILDVSAEILGWVDGVYDRAALVALPAEMRQRYTAHLMKITGQAPQFLITYEYDQMAMAGPPFSVDQGEVMGHYGDSYDLTLITSTDVVGGLKGQCAAKENVWLLRTHH